MKFVMIEDFDWDISKDKVVLGELHTDDSLNDYTFTYTTTLAYLLRIEDFKEDDEYNILRNTDSIQIRPKAIYKNDKGYYKKVDGKRVYFEGKEIVEIENAIQKFKKYLEEA